MPTFKVGDTVIFSDYDALKEWFTSTMPRTALFLAQPDDVMIVEALWDVGQLYVQAPKWGGVLPSRFFKLAEGDSNAHPSQK